MMVIFISHLSINYNQRLGFTMVEIIGFITVIFICIKIFKVITGNLTTKTLVNAMKWADEQGVPPEEISRIVKEGTLMNYKLDELRRNSLDFKALDVYVQYGRAIVEEYFDATSRKMTNAKDAANLWGVKEDEFNLIITEPRFEQIQNFAKSLTQLPTFKLIPYDYVLGHAIAAYTMTESLDESMNSRDVSSVYAIKLFSFYLMRFYVLKDNKAIFDIHLLLRRFSSHIHIGGSNKCWYDWLETQKSLSLYDINDEWLLLAITLDDSRAMYSKAGQVIYALSHTNLECAEDETEDYARYLVVKAATLDGDDIDKALEDYGL